MVTKVVNLVGVRFVIEKDDSLIRAQILTMSLWNVKVNNSDLIASIKMQIKSKSLRRTSLISYQSGNYKDWVKGSGRLNECLLASGSWKQEK